MRTVTTQVLIAAICAAFAFGCADESGTEGNSQVVMPGKADNFYSNLAQEYFVSGHYYVEVEPEYLTKTEEEKNARVRELIGYKQVAINWFLLKYLTQKDDEDNLKIYALTKNGSYDDLMVHEDLVKPGKFYFTFQQEIGGQMDLLERIKDLETESNSGEFVLTVGKVPNHHLELMEPGDEWFTYLPWAKFDPSTIDASKKEDILLSVTPQPRSRDAWPDFNALFADGVVTVGIHFGWDYQTNFHLRDSEKVYNYLTNDMKFDSPVASYADYTRTSGPLTKTIDANGKDVKVKVWLFWGKSGTAVDTDTDEGGRILEADLRDSFKNREVIIYTGHSGPFYGFALANWNKTNEGDLDDSEIPEMEMPSTYQLVLAEACETYGLGEAFWKNPAKKDEKNLDIITTTSFASGSNTGVLMYFILSMFGSNPHIPWTFSRMINRFDSSSGTFNTMYGVHGIDNNPRLHPYGNLGKLCKSCSWDSDCGDYGNHCVQLETEKICTVECIDDYACPTGYICAPYAEDTYIQGSVCVPGGFTCKAGGLTNIVKSPLIINEIFPAPYWGLGGDDANGDGFTLNWWDDEFVEVVNSGLEPLDISGYRIVDATGTRFTFPSGSKLSPGKAAVVFGGGDKTKISQLQGLTGSLAFASGGLGLDNDGDQVTLSDGEGRIVDSVIYPKPEHGQSFVRKVDGNPESEFVISETGYTPGVRQDKSSF